MAIEHDFQAAIEANPADGMLRQVIADGLQERGDRRADGYRTLGKLHVRPIEFELGLARGFAWFGSAFEHPAASNALPAAWFLAASGQTTAEYPHDLWPRHTKENHKRFPDRRRLQDAVALAWLAVSEADRKKILADAEKSV